MTDGMQDFDFLGDFDSHQNDESSESSNQEESSSQNDDESNTSSYVEAMGKSRKNRLDSLSEYLLVHNQQVYMPVSMYKDLKIRDESDAKLEQMLFAPEKYYSKNTIYYPIVGSKPSDILKITSNNADHLYEYIKSKSSGEEISSTQLTTAQKIEKLREEETDAQIRKIKSSLFQATSQFDTTSFYGREDIQNSLDAGASRIDVNFSYKEKKSGNIGIISFTDNGHGMSYEVIRKKLLTLFDSTKEEDAKKVGRFGIGFVSNFAQPNLEKLVVSTSTGTEDHEVTLFTGSKDWKGSVSKSKNPRKESGTTVSLHVRENNPKEFSETQRELSEFIIEYCSKIKTPLFIDGRQVNTR